MQETADSVREGDDCFVWPPKLCHIRKAIRMCTLAHAGLVPFRDDETELQWRAYSQRLATSLRSARERAGLSQEDVAYRSGLTRYTYQKYEKGESRPGTPSNPTLRTILAISQVLGTPLSSLIPDDAPDLRTR